MQTIKIIDLIIMLANDEEVPKKIRYQNYIYEYQHRRDTENSFNYMCNENGEYLSRRYFIDNILNDEVEIIEEDKDIESIETYKNYLEKANEKYDSGYLLDVYLQGMSQRLIELIDIVNDLKKKGKSE